MSLNAIYCTSILYFLFKEIYFFYVHVCMFHVMWMPMKTRSVLGPQELELQLVVSCPNMDTGN